MKPLPYKNEDPYSYNILKNERGSFWTRLRAKKLITKYGGTKDVWEYICFSRVDLEKNHAMAKTLRLGA